MTRDQFVQKLKADLELWSVQAEEWEAKARAMRAELRSAFERARSRFGSPQRE